jgi:hypothetical protein
MIAFGSVGRKVGTFFSKQDIITFYFVSYLFGGLKYTGKKKVISENKIVSRRKERIELCV